MNARDLFEMLEPVLADVRSKVSSMSLPDISPLPGFFLEEAKRQHAEAGPVTRIASGFAAGILAGKVVGNLAR